MEIKNDKSLLILGFHQVPLNSLLIRSRLLSFLSFILLTILSSISSIYRNFNQDLHLDNFLLASIAHMIKIEPQDIIIMAL